MKKKVALVGASGKTGSLVVTALSNSPDFELGAALVSDRSRLLGQPVVKDSVCIYTHDLRSGIENSDAVIDFSTPTTSTIVAELASNALKPCLIATTGHTPSHIELFKACSSKIPLLLASNTSLGVAILSELIRYTSAALAGHIFDAHIVETHHKAKKDAPSGTAKHLAACISSEIGAVPISSIRAGDVVGDHITHFFFGGEKIELRHAAHSRTIFAEGAISLLSMLITKGAGLYSVSDILKTENPNSKIF